jgi:hypothetical protein
MAFGAGGNEVSVANKTTGRPHPPEQNVPHRVEAVAAGIQKSRSMCQRRPVVTRLAIVSRMTNKAPLFAGDFRSSVHFGPAGGFMALWFLAGSTKLAHLAVFAFSMTIGALAALPPYVRTFPSSQ